jgi:hypothetical protein
MINNTSSNEAHYGEARHDVLDGVVLHLDVGRTGVPGCCAGEETFFVRRPKKIVVLLASCIVF